MKLTIEENGKERELTDEEYSICLALAIGQLLAKKKCDVCKPLGFFYRAGICDIPCGPKDERDEMQHET